MLAKDYTMHFVIQIYRNLQYKYCCCCIFLTILLFMISIDPELKLHNRIVEKKVNHIQIVPTRSKDRFQQYQG